MTWVEQWKQPVYFLDFYVQKNVLKEGDSLSLRLHFAKKIENPGKIIFHNYRTFKVTSHSK